MNNNNLVTIYVNGDFATNQWLEDNHVEIYNKGEVYQVKQMLYEKFMDDLEKKGYDNYFCPELYKHPEWNGIIKYFC